MSISEHAKKQYLGTLLDGTHVYKFSNPAVLAQYDAEQAERNNGQSHERPGDSTQAEDENDTGTPEHAEPPDEPPATPRSRGGKPLRSSPHGLPAHPRIPRSAAARAQHRLALLGRHTLDTGRYRRRQTRRARRAAHALADSLGDKELQRDIRRCESDRGVNGVLGIASALHPFAATVRDLDADPYLLNTANGTLDLRTMTATPA